MTRALEEQQVGSSWLDQRAHPDLPAEAERAIRQAGLAWHREADAEEHLARAARVAPGHLAVLVAHYRYHFYKHHYVQAAQFARQCLDVVAVELGIPRTFTDVGGEHADFTGNDPVIRFWLFGMQAYGYVLLRLDQPELGRCVLEKVVELDRADHTKTAALLQVIARAGVEED